MAAMAEDGFWARRWSHVVSEWRVILQAKTLFGSAALLLTVGTAVVVWRVITSLDNAEIAGLNATIKADEATIRFEDIRLRGTLPASPVPATPSNPDVDFSNLRPLSNAALKGQVGRLTQSLRQFEAKYENEMDAVSSTPRYTTDQKVMQNNWESMNKKENELRESETYAWQTTYRGRVAAIYEELSRRLAIPPISDASLSATNNNITDSEATELLKTGMISGIYPIAALADYLESLAGQL
jgi:hypothetical protein